ncbi:MAG: hypothetical protein M5U19_21275 [Microthrixaceae bacterium]|nr:hypothetical protein [Microthrixaceae bacterium]
MDFREYTVESNGREIVVKGTINEPVHWDFSIRMCEDDLPGITRVVLQKATLKFLIRSIFTRKKENHWSVSKRGRRQGQRRRRQEVRCKGGSSGEARGCQGSSPQDLRRRNLQVSGRLQVRYLTRSGNPRSGGLLQRHDRSVREDRQRHGEGRLHPGAKTVSFAKPASAAAEATCNPEGRRGRTC